VSHPLRVSLCSSRYWAAKAPPFKVNLRLNPSQSKAATDTGSSRNATTPFCEVAKFQSSNLLTLSDYLRAAPLLLPPLFREHLLLLPPFPLDFERNNVSAKKKNATTNLQPKPLAECTQEPSKGATLNTDGRGCVVRSLNKRAIQRHFNCLRGPPVVGTPNATNEGIHDQWETKAKLLFEEHQYKQVYLEAFFSEDRALPVDGREKQLYLGLERAQGLLLKGDSHKPQYNKSRGFKEFLLRLIFSLLSLPF
jgi:hypothetical protein